MVRSSKVTALEEGKPSQATTSIHLVSVRHVVVVIRLDVADWSQHAPQGWQGGRRDVRSWFLRVSWGSIQPPQQL